MTTSDLLRPARDFYDAVAADYAEHFHDELANKPLDRAMLAAFAELVRGAGGRVADLGCGPGRTTAHLDSLGLPVFGVDLSPRMVEVARRIHPHSRFHRGSMLSLDLADDSLGGILAWYSIIHTPREQLPELFAEFARVLRPGGQVALAFQVGDESLNVAEPFGHPVALDFNRLRPDHVVDLLSRAGLVTHARLVREADDALAERTQQAYLLAARPTGPDQRAPG